MPAPKHNQQLKLKTLNSLKKHKVVGPRLVFRRGSESTFAGFRGAGGGGGGGGEIATLGAQERGHACWHTTGHGNTAADRPQPASAEDPQQRSQCSVRGRHSQLAGSMSWSITRPLAICKSVHPGSCCAVFCCRHTSARQNVAEFEQLPAAKDFHKDLQEWALT